MTDHNCDTCENYKPSDRYYDTNGVHRTKPEYPEMRALSREQCEFLKEHGRLSSVWYKNITFDNWVEPGRAHIDSINPLFIRESRLGYPVTDRFWKEWDEMQKLKDPFVGKKVWWTGRYSKTGSRISKARFVQCTYNDHDTRQNYRIVVDGIAEWVDTSELSITPPPLVKVWSIDKTGKVTEKELYGQPDWKELRNMCTDNKVIVWSNSIKIKTELGTPFGIGNNYYVLYPENGGEFKVANPVESIRAEIKKRNAPKFKVGQYCIDAQNDERHLCIVIQIMPNGEYEVRDKNDFEYLLEPQFIDMPTRSDFEVKRVGPDGVEHTWLAVEVFAGIEVYCNGSVVATFPTGSRLFHTFIDLSVCPAEVK